MTPTPPQPPADRSTWSMRFLSHFRRVTTSGAFISEIDGLRFIAIGTVVLFHLVVNLAIKSPIAYAVPESGNILYAVARHGFRGVELFFIISGFILAYPFASHYLKNKPRVQLKQYFLRRLTRLEPPYMICMILFYLARVQWRGEDSGELFPHLLASLAYLHNIVYKAESLVNNVAWSLEIEVQFYILVPLLSRIFAIRDTLRRRTLIISIITLSSVHAWLFIGPESILYLTIVRFLHFFLLGFLLSDIYLMDWKEQPRRAWRWDLVALFGWPALFLIWNMPEVSQAILPAGHEPVLGALLFPPIALFLYIATFRGRVTNAILTNPWITTIGGMCYTIYLFHNQVMGAIIGVTRILVPTSIYTLNILVQGVLVIPAMLVVTALYFIAIERPCMRKDWPKRLADRVILLLGFVPKQKETKAS